jgi:hypothetical protein
MLKFKDFLNEETGADVIEIDSKYLLSNKETINTHLDTLTEKPYQNAPIFLTQLRGALEVYGMSLPAEATANFLNLSSELVYALGDTGLNLYIVYDTNEEDGQIVTSDELDDLVQMDTEELLGDREEIQMRPSTWYAKRDDDSGNTDEYS